MVNTFKLVGNIIFGQIGSPWSRFYKLRCEPYTAWLTPAGCRANRTAAKDALHTLQEGLEPWEVTMPGLDRLLTCGRCPRGAELQPITTEWILTLIEECLSRLERPCARSDCSLRRS